MGLQIAQDETADRVLNDHPFALVAGMMLDQQYPMEHAFRGPAKILERFGTLDPEAIAEADGEQFSSLCCSPPAIHRFPASMASRMQSLASHIVEEYDGDTTLLWTDVPDGRALMKRVQAMPGFGKQKSQIFVALLAKQLGVRPAGWQAAAGSYSEAGYRSVADVVDQESLQKVRDFKKASKAAQSS